MSLLFSVVFRTACQGTHQRLAVDALRHLRGPDAERWSDLLLYHHAAYLAGCLAPDERFRDFRNHVLYPGQQPWGGAPQEAGRWYARVVDALRRREWQEAAYDAGVLSHYFSDPFFPLQTAASEQGFSMQWAVERCVSALYGRLQHWLESELGGYPQLETPRRQDWLPRMIQTGATLARQHYSTILDHFDLSRAARSPAEGLDEAAQECLALCLGHAVIGLARVLETAFAEAEVEPPHTETTLRGFLLLVQGPARAACRAGGEWQDAMTLEATRDEIERTGKAVRSMSVEAREVRRLHSEEVLRLPLFQLDQRPAALAGTLYGSGCQERHLPNRLITAPAFPFDRDASPAWREARRQMAA